MAKRSSPETNEMKIFRRVHGLEQFQAQVRALGSIVFGAEIVGSIPLHDQNGDGEAVVRYKNVEEDRLKVYDSDKLEFHHLYRRTFKSQNYGSKFSSHINSMQRHLSFRGQRSRLLFVDTANENDDLGLREVMSRVGDDYGISDQTNIPVRFDAIVPRPDPLTRGGTELGLSLSLASPSALMLVEQTEMCMRGLYRNLKNLPDGVEHLSVAFARLPDEASHNEIEEFYYGTKDFLPTDIAYLSAVETSVTGPA